ncbi:MAG: ferrochelatase, partial [Pseudomonadota bacterium]
MPRFESQPLYEHGQPDALGILLVNLGTPDEPKPKAVRRYLAQFLSDPRVVELPRLLWWLILHGVILRVRPARSAEAYQKIWTEKGSPLLLYSQDVVRLLNEALKARLAGNVHVELAMTYGEPSVDAGLDRLHANGARRVLVVPMYPQYSNTTTGSVFAAAAEGLTRRRWIPEFRFINHYHDVPGYIDALAASVRDHWAQHDRGERLLFSFHGVPRRTLLSGDPYHCQCQKTARLVAERLGLGADDWHVSFQSRVGREEWLKPYTDETLEDWGRNGVGDIDVICPAFSVDCLETLEEISMEGAEQFAEAGGGELRYIPCLNDRDDHISVLA